MSDLTSRSQLDQLRGVAVLGMLLTHVAHVTHTNEPATRATVHAILAAEPVVTHAFFWVSGAAAAASTRPCDGVRLKRALRRWALLWALGVGLFLLQFGVQLPDVALSPDVLAPLGALGVLVTLLRARPAALLLSAALVIGAPLLLPPGISGLDAGPGGAFPLLACGLVGAAVHRLEAPQRAHVQRALGALAVCSAVLLVGGVTSFVTRVPSNYVCYAELPALAQLTGWWTGASSGQPCVRWFWNPTPVGTALCTAALAALEAFTPQSLVFPALYRLGRTSLLVYVTHLLVLGALDAAGAAVNGAAAALALLALLLLGALALAALKERAARQRARAP